MKRKGEGEGKGREGKGETDRPTDRQTREEELRDPGKTAPGGKKKINKIREQNVAPVDVVPIQCPVSKIDTVKSAVDVDRDSLDQIPQLLKISPVYHGRQHYRKIQNRLLSV